MSWLSAAVCGRRNSRTNAGCALQRPVEGNIIRGFTLDHMHLTDDQFLRVLHRTRDRIVDGEALRLYDSNETGNKFTSASWGMCNMEAGFWERDELLFPERGAINIGMRKIDPKSGATIPLLSESSKYQRPHQLCPFDKNSDAVRDPTGTNWGCYDRCRLFRPEDDVIVRRPDAVTLYEVRISQFEKSISDQDNHDSTD